MFSAIKRKLRKTPARLLLTYFRLLFSGRRSQSKESEILADIIRRVSVPNSFIEFGFQIDEFNCTQLTKAYRGLLIDGDDQATRIARRFLPKNVEARTAFLTLDNLSIIETKFAEGDLGVLSIDVDGNDYWFLERLIKLRPSIVIVEYNASFGLNPITVPYDSKFVRHEKHQSGWYHGASITALTSLATKNRYSLVAVDPAGANIFFVSDNLLTPDITILLPKQAYRENMFRNKWSNTVVSEQWEVIKDLPYVDVTT